MSNIYETAGGQFPAQPGANSSVLSILALLKKFDGKLPLHATIDELGPVTEDGDKIAVGRNGNGDDINFVLDLLKKAVKEKLSETENKSLKSHEPLILFIGAVMTFLDVVDGKKKVGEKTRLGSFQDVGFVVTDVIKQIKVKNYVTPSKSYNALATPAEDFTSTDIDTLMDMMAEKTELDAMTAFYNDIVFLGFNKDTTIRAALKLFGIKGCMQLALIACERGTNVTVIGGFAITMIDDTKKTIAEILQSGKLVASARRLSRDSITMNRMGSAFCDQVAYFYFKHATDRGNQFADSCLPGWMAFPASIGVNLGHDSMYRTAIYSDLFSSSMPQRAKASNTTVGFNMQIIKQANQSAKMRDVPWFKSMVAAYKIYADAHPVPDTWTIRAKIPSSPSTPLVRTDFMEPI